MSLAAPPPPGTPVPAPIAEWAAAHGRRVAELVWRNGVGGITARLVSDDAKDLFAKWSPDDLEPEAERLSWLSSRHPSPRMFDYEETADGWLIVTGALVGGNAVADRWQLDPGRAAFAIGEGYARLHSLDPADCPFGPAEWIGCQDDVDVLVITHGDACAPNTILSDDGAFVGHVDMGDLGVADRWADLAIASWSLEWNFGPGHEDAFWAGYGEAPDPERIRRYRTLWDA
ncbi:MAG TPA: phosphotransferase [Tessaracoccus flavescens]|uniref:Phosphotransferase n=1 Tax=Tessaracoccus flavescens TaxID=399497 RepID=A0A921EKV7_9ACTN|nr:phosphotransferase [Tessaracoccus flavescens]